MVRIRDRDVQLIDPLTDLLTYRLKTKDYRLPMANLQGFDANTVEPADDLEPIPAGKYVAVITDSEMKPTKSGIGSYLQLTFTIIEGE